MTVEEKVRKIVEQMGVTYLFENWQAANVRLDKMQLPAVMYVLPASGNLNVGLMQMKDFPNCMIAFMDKTKHDFSGEENDMVIERCKSLAREFILNVNRSGMFEPVQGDIQYSVFYDKLDVNVTGIVIHIPLKEIRGIVICPTKTVKEIVYGTSAEG